MLNPFADVNWNPDMKERRKFARSLVIGFPLMAALFEMGTRLATHAWKPLPLWIGGVGAVVGAFLWILPRVARPFYVVWYSIACSMGLIVGNLLLTAVFYLLLTPIGLLMRATGHPPFHKSFDKGRHTYWRDAPKIDDLNGYYRQF